jgi:hypothetical protein
MVISSSKGTIVGNSEADVLPSPNCPLSLAPQQIKIPPLSTAQVWLEPESIEITLKPSGKSTDIASPDDVPLGSEPEWPSCP